MRFIENSNTYLYIYTVQFFMNEVQTSKHDNKDTLKLGPQAFFDVDKIKKRGGLKERG